MQGPVIVCGLGRVGRRVLEYLQAAELPIVVVDWQCQPGDPRLKGVRLVRGDCRREETLREAGADQARAVLLVTSDDLVNISAALAARHLNRTVRIVIRMFNQNMIQRLGSALPNTYALSVSALTAPLLALTALTGAALGAFTLADGRRRQVAETSVSGFSRLAGLRLGEISKRYGVTVLAYQSASGRGIGLADGFETWRMEQFLLDVDAEAKVAVDDRLVLCGSPRSLRPLTGPAPGDTDPAVRMASWFRRTGRMLVRTLREMDFALRVATGVLLGVIALGTTVYYFGVEKSLPDAFYRTISVMATGADMHEEELRLPWQKVFVSVLRVTGAALLAGFTAIFTNYLLRARLGGALEVRRIPDGGHVVVCGLGNIGFRVVEELLRHEERVVVIERARDSRFLATARRLGVAVLVGDATVTEVLRQAKVDSARAVVAVTDNELANLEIALLSRGLNPGQRVVVRLSDTQLAETLRAEADIRLALSMPALAAPAFVAGLYGDRVQCLFLAFGKMVAVVEVVVQPEDDHLLGEEIGALAADYRILPLFFQPASGPPREPALDLRLSMGDRLTIIALFQDLEKLFRREKAPPA